MDLTCEEVAAVFIASENISLKLKPERVGVHEINKNREEYGEYHHLFQDLLEDRKRFFEYFRMEIETFNYILNCIEPQMERNWCNLHKQKILPQERLVVTLRYLSTGISFRALAFSFRMGKTTIANIAKETVSLIWEQLQPIHMIVPTPELLRVNASEFERIWNFPHVVGCLDGKHIRIKCPENSGSMFFNYKHFFSIVLQGLVDANYRFICIDVGGFGKQSDGGTFLSSDLYRFINEKIIDFPQPKYLPNSTAVAPYVMLADEGYPLLTNLLTPYKRKVLTPQRRNYNKRLSRARKTVECSFGMLYSKWRIIAKPIETSVGFADSIVKCVCLLQNIIIDKEGFERHLTEVSIQGGNVTWERRGRNPSDAKSIRDTFLKYFEKYPLEYSD